MRNSGAPQTHPYKIFRCSHDNPYFKVDHVDNKNPAVFWKTDMPCESAFFELKFAKARITGIEITNMISPQISVRVYNMDSQGNPIDVYECIQKRILIVMNDYLQSKIDAKTRKIDFRDDPMMAHKEYSFMRVTVSNPFHNQKPTNLGLVSLILLAKAEDLKANPETPNKQFLRQIDKDVTDNLMKSIGIERVETGVRVPNYRAAHKRDSLFDDIEDADKPTITPRRVSGRGIDEQGAVLKRGWYDMNNSDGIQPYYGAETKKIKPNFIRERETRRLKSFAEQDRLREDEDLQKILKESEKTFKQEQERRQQAENHRWDYTDKFLYKKRPDERGRGEHMWKGEEKENTQDMDDFQRAVEESKKTHRQEMGIEIDETLIETTKETGEENFYKAEKLFEDKYEKKEDLFVGFGLRKKRREELSRNVNVKDPEEVKEYYDMLERCAEEEEAELGGNEDGIEDAENEEEERNNEEDNLTDMLENSMANLWADSQEVQSKENQEKEKEMEIEQLVEEFEQPKKLNEGYRNGNGNHVPQRTYYHLLKTFDHMVPLSEEDYTSEYLQNEMKAKKELENKQGKGKGVEVVSSHQDILKEVVFSLGGFSGDEKKHLKDMTVSMGARFIDELYPGVTTHLIARNSGLNKYQTAKNMKDVLIVSKEWIDSCYEQKKRLDERDFQVSNDQEYE